MTDLAVWPQLARRGGGGGNVSDTSVDATSPIAAAAGGRNRALRDFVSAYDFGVAGNGATDDTAALLAASNYARNAGKRLWIPRGRFKVSGAITDPVNTNPIVVSGDGPGVTEFLMQDGQTNPVIWRVGVLSPAPAGPGIALTAPSAAGQAILKVPDTSNPDIQVGRHILLIDPTSSPVYGNTAGPGTIGVQGSASEWVRVKAILNGTDLLLHGALEYSYTTGNGFYRVLIDGANAGDLEGFSIKWAGTTGAQAATARGVSFTYWEGLRCAHIKHEGFEANCFNIPRGHNASLHDLEFLNTNDDLTASSPYCIAAGNSQHLLIRGVRSRFGRHVYTAGGDLLYGLAAHVHVSDCIARDHMAAAFDTHPGSRYITFENCHAYAPFPYEAYYGINGETAGFQLRGPDQAVINCTAHGMPDHGVYAVWGAHRARILGCKFTGCYRGIEAESSQDVYIGGGTVIDTPTNDAINFAVRDPDWTGLVTRIFIGEVLVTGNPGAYAVNNESNLSVVYL